MELLWEVLAPGREEKPVGLDGVTPDVEDEVWLLALVLQEPTQELFEGLPTLQAGGEDAVGPQQLSNLVWKIEWATTSQ